MLTAKMSFCFLHNSYEPHTIHCCSMNAYMLVRWRDELEITGINKIQMQRSTHVTKRSFLFQNDLKIEIKYSDAMNY